MDTLPASPSIRLLLVLANLLAALLGVGRGDISLEASPDASPTAGCITAAPPPAQDRVQLTLEAVPPANVRLAPEATCAARDVMAARLAGIGIDATVAVVAGFTIVVDLSHADNHADIGATPFVTRVGLLEIVDTRGAFPPTGSLVTTSLGGPDAVLPPSAYAGEPVDDAAYETILTGADLTDAYATTDGLGQQVAAFALDEAAADRFFAFTRANVGRPMAILFDKRVISTPVIQGAISGQAVIVGLDENEVAAVVVQLQVQSELGTLPAPFELVAVDGAPVAAPVTEASPDTGEAPPLDGTPAP